ncbi:MAG: hypothetical protein EP307_14360 [Rhodobacteraceae bacterium]|nr:MAG: hypothetical protein EP307_14360 [Paracoccaceae bacterium]
MRCVLALCLCLLGLPLPGWAGPWPREKGQTFVATGGTYRYAAGTMTVSQEVGIYAEYGLGQRITLGFDAMNDMAAYSHARLFVRLPLSADRRRLKLALTLAVGMARQGLDWAPSARADLSLGRDHGLGQGGWWSLALSLEGGSLQPEPLAKLDADFGLKLGPRLDMILQMQASGRGDASRDVRLVPGVIWRMTPAMRLHLGVEARRADEVSFGLRAALWREF